MFKLDSEAELLKAFRPKDRGLVEVTPEVKPPRFVRTYLAWAHPAGGRQYLVFSVPGGVPTGIVFETNGGSGAVPAMCDWCHGASIGGTVGILAARKNAKKTVGIHVCTDLGCQERIEDEANRQGRSAVPALAALLERMGRFASEALDIDLSGAGR